MGLEGRRRWNDLSWRYSAVARDVVPVSGVPEVVAVTPAPIVHYPLDVSPHLAHTPQCSAPDRRNGRSVGPTDPISRWRSNAGRMKGGEWQRWTCLIQPHRQYYFSRRRPPAPPARSSTESTRTSEYQREPRASSLNQGYPISLSVA